MSCENHSGPEELAGRVSLNSQRRVYCLLWGPTGQGIAWKEVSNLCLAYRDSKLESWGQDSPMGEASFSWVSQTFGWGKRDGVGGGGGGGQAWGPSGPQNKVGCSGITSMVLGWGRGWWPLGVQMASSWVREDSPAGRGPEWKDIRLGSVYSQRPVPDGLKCGNSPGMGKPGAAGLGSLDILSPLSSLRLLP